MSSSRWQAVSAMVTILAVVPAAWAQPSTPRIGYVYPAGGQQGTSFQVRVGGQFLDGVARVYISGPGVQGAVVEHVKPINSQQANTLREKLLELQKKPRGPDTQKEIDEIRKQLATFRPPNPAIAEVVTVQVTLAANVETGKRELRLGTPRGLTNPLVFCIGQLPEFSKPASNAAREPRGGNNQRGRGPMQGGTAEPEMTITLPAIVNGQIMPGGVDRYRFHARKGQSLVIAATARELIPYLADAVPGWFQATLALYDAKGGEMAYNDDFRFHPDPVLFCQIPDDGEYVIEIKDAIYRGREDFVYRIALGELPFVTSIFPQGGKSGTQTPVEVKGWNLPMAGLTQDSRDKGPGIYRLSVSKDGLISNEVPFAVDTLPECLEREPDNPQGSAQQVTLPIIVNGRIDKSGDWDVFRFEGRAGDEIVTEVYARRLDSPLDSVLRLTDAKGRQLAFNDDHEDKGAGLTTHHADSWLHATLPANGTYDLHLGDAQHNGGPEYGYRLRISPPLPDFELRVAPSSIGVRGGSSVPFTVYALRKDGFSNEISLAWKDAPEGFTLSGGRIPANQDQVRITLTAPPTPIEEPVSLSLEGRATIQGQEIRRPALPAEDMMQAFAYRHLVTAQDLKVTVSGRWMSRAPLRILDPAPVKIPAGGTARVRVGAPGGVFTNRFQLELSEPPEGVTIQDVSSIREGAEIVLHSDATKAKPGLSGNLIVNVLAVGPQNPGKDKGQGNRQRTLVGTLPAIPFDIVGPQ